MKESHLPMLEHAVQQMNLWLKQLEERHHFRDRHHAYSALRAVLHALRDRLTPEQAVHLGAQLPTIVRGIFYEGWHPASTPTNYRQVQDFASRVAAQLPPGFPRDPLSTSKSIFELLEREIDSGEIAKVKAVLPEPLRGLWSG